MDEETLKKKLKYAGPKIASMNRRLQNHDYQGRQIYLITKCVWKDGGHSSVRWLATCTNPWVLPMPRACCPAPSARPSSRTGKGCWHGYRR